MTERRWAHRTSQTVTGGDMIAQLQALHPDACVVSACGVVTPEAPATAA